MALGYQSSKTIMVCSLRYRNTIILFLGRYLIGVLECHQLINLLIQISIMDLLRPEKKSSNRLLAGCAVVSVFGSGNYNRE